MITLLAAFALAGVFALPHGDRPDGNPGFVLDEVAVSATTSSCSSVLPAICGDDDWECSSDDWRAYAAATVGAPAVGIPAVALNEHYRGVFQSACWRHDGCYRHGKATYGHTKSACDNMFYEDMKDICPDVDNFVDALTVGISSAACLNVARAYYEGVKALGDDSYHSATSTYCAYDGRNENAHVHRIHADGRFGTADHRYMWSSGWWVTTSYRVGNEDRLLLLKPGNGRVHIHKPVPSGAVASKIANYNWSSGWTTVSPYRVKDESFVLLLKVSNGEAQVRRLNPDGTIGEKIKEYNWTRGWTTAEFYEIAGKTYLLLLKGEDLRLRYMLQWLMLDAPGGSGRARVYRMNADGTVDVDQVKEYDWSSGWSIVRPYRIGGKHYMLFLKSDNGVVHLNRIENDGTFGERVGTYNWSSGWTTAEPFYINDQAFLFILKAGNGAAKVYQMTKDGKIGALVKEYDWRDGWTSATFYTVNGQLYALLVKAVLGGT